MQPGDIISYLKTRQIGTQDVVLQQKRTQKLKQGSFSSCLSTTLLIT